MVLKSPKNKINPCQECGKPSTGKLCFKCDIKTRTGRTYSGKKNPDEKLLQHKDTRPTYFQKKYGKKEEKNND